MSAFDECPNASHRTFPYYFDDTEGITFGFEVISLLKYNYDLAIYYGNMGSEDFLDCRCSRYDISNYDIIVETWLKKSNLQTLLNNVKPGAVKELYTILGKPFYYDSTWSSENTLKILPTPSSAHMNESALKYMRNEKLIYVSNITTHPVNENWTEIKIEGKISGNVAL